jgi:periplasmic protein TonB
MGYQALLFCPDDKTARTVTQVLSELEFTVEACIEPFAAVKKLMGQHFDAVVVDCDNEQNATLLFKSARNSTSNQTSLAVAVVEGQAGVAKAFRIGANLVLTKPINIEQAKGTLRVARGLLRKSEPGKPGSATATGSFAVPTTPVPTPAQASAAPSTPAATPAAAAPKPAPKPAASTARPSSLPPKPVPPAAKPTSTPAWPAAAKPAAPIPPAPTPVAEKPAAPPVPPAPPVLYSAAVATPPSPPRASTPTSTSEFRPPVPSAPVTGGAASAPAPALEPPQPKIEQKPRAAAEDLFEKPAEAVQSEPAPYAGSAPSFSFGGATEERESAGGSKKVLIGVAAAVLIAAVGYFGYSHLKGSSSSSQPAATSTPVSASESSKPSTAQPANTMTATTSAPVSQPDITLGTASASSENERTSSATSEHSRPSAGSTKSANAAAAPAKSPVAEKTAEKPLEEEEQPEAPALVVKGGKVPTAQPATAPPADAPAPSLIGMGASTAAPLPNLGTSDGGVKPKLQTVSVSQGVSQGLLYKKVAPSYPQNALRMHIDGTVELLATISKDGNITHIKVLSGDAQLAKAASDAVKQWKYKPYLLNGEPVEIQTQVTVNFKLPH